MGRKHGRALRAVYTAVYVTGRLHGPVHDTAEMRCTRLAANTGRKKVAKNRHLGTIAQLCWAISSQLRHVSTIGKKIVKQQYLLYMS